MGDVTQMLIEHLLSAHTLAAAAGVFAFVLYINRLMKRLYKVVDNVKVKKALKVGRRLLPLLDQVIGVCIVFLPGAVPLSDDAQLGEILVKGMWVGFVASKLHKLIDQTFLGNDKIIKDGSKEDVG